MFPDCRATYNAEQLCTFWRISCHSNTSILPDYGPSNDAIEHREISYTVQHTNHTALEIDCEAFRFRCRNSFAVFGQLFSPSDRCCVPSSDGRSDNVASKMSYRNHHNWILYPFPVRDKGLCDRVVCTCRWKSSGNEYTFKLKQILIE